METNIKLEELKDYLNNKSLAIIGSGTCIENNEWGEDIDKHDIVIRINNSFRNLSWDDKKRQKYVGKRTDIYVANGDTDHKRGWAVKAESLGVKYIFRLNPAERGNNRCSRLQMQLLQEVSNVYMAWDFAEEANKLKTIEFKGARPATGAMLIKWLTIHINFKSISLYGFDFFKEFEGIVPFTPNGGNGNPRIKYGKQNKFWNDYQCSWRGCHSIKAEGKWFKKYINKYNITHNI